MTKDRQITSAFEIYTVKGGPLVQVSDPLHQQVLHLLADNPMSTSDIAEATGKAPSTLFVNLEAMTAKGLVSSEFDPADSRRKIYRSNSRLLAFSEEPNNASMPLMIKAFDGLADAQGDYNKQMLRLLLLSLQNAGINLDPLMWNLGEGLGSAMADRTDLTRVEDLISHVKSFYSKNDLGELSVYSFSPLVIIVRDSVVSRGFRSNTKYSLTQGLLTALLSKRTGRAFKVASGEVYGQDNEYFRFTLEMPPHGEGQ